MIDTGITTTSLVLAVINLALYIFNSLYFIKHKDTVSGFLALTNLITIAIIL